MVRLWRTEWFERTSPIERVDFGNGQQISVVDLLEGHFRYIFGQQRSAAHDVHTTINTIAPTLTPLTDLAEEVAQTLPATGPTPYFKDTLNKGLILTHRQHHAQRMLGIRPTVEKTYAWRDWFVVSLILTIISLGLVSIRVPKQSKCVRIR